jgi:hypothetical protein
MKAVCLSGLVLLYFYGNRHHDLVAERLAQRAVAARQAVARIW